MRGKSGKKAIFRPENRNGVMGWRTRKTDKEMEVACIAAIDTQIA